MISSYGISNRKHVPLRPNVRFCAHTHTHTHTYTHTNTPTHTYKYTHSLSSVCDRIISVRITLIDFDGCYLFLKGQFMWWLQSGAYKAYTSLPSLLLFLPIITVDENC